MIKELTKKQNEVLKVIQNHITIYGKAPTLDEIRKTLGMNYISTVQKHIDALERKGYISRDGGGYRNLSIKKGLFNYVKIPVLGNVACGNPLYAEENIEAYIPYSKSNIRINSSSYFFLRAVGDSMDKAGIDDGDFVLVKSQNSAEPNDIILALIGDEATIKKYKVMGGQCVLEPMSTNPVHKPIYLFEDFIIQGVIQDVLKMKGGEKQ